MSTEGISLHRCVGWIFCETPARTFGIFAADCAEVLKRRLFFTGRLHVRDQVQKHVFGNAEISPISSRKHDIRLYLLMGLNRDSELDAMDRVLEAGILRIIPEVTSGIFLLVSFNIDAIFAEATIHTMSTPIVLINPADHRSRGLREVIWE